MQHCDSLAQMQNCSHFWHWNSINSKELCVSFWQNSPILIPPRHDISFDFRDTQLVNFHTREKHTTFLRCEHVDYVHQIWKARCFAGPSAVKVRLGEVLLMYLGRSGVMGSVSAHILPAWLRARQVLSGCGGEGVGRRDNDCWVNQRKPRWC